MRFHGGTDNSFCIVFFIWLWKIFLAAYKENSEKKTHSFLPWKHILISNLYRRHNANPYTIYNRHVSWTEGKLKQFNGHLCDKGWTELHWYDRTESGNITEASPVWSGPYQYCGFAYFGFFAIRAICCCLLQFALLYFYCCCVYLHQSYWTDSFPSPSLVHGYIKVAIPIVVAVLTGFFARRDTNAGFEILINFHKDISENCGRWLVSLVRCRYTLSS